MRIVTEKTQLKDGQIFRRKRDMRNRIYPDFLALYNQPGTYHKTRLTAVCFYSYDYTFDGINGLYNAIYYNDRRLLAKYKERFQGVKYFISPDYSVFADLYEPENQIRLWKARIVSLWLALELHAITIPSATYISESTFPKYFDGLEQCSVIAFSTKGHVRYARERNLLKAAVKYAVDNLPLRTILVYSVCGKDETSLQLFKYATDKGINVVIPNNILRERHMERRGDS